VIVFLGIETFWMQGFSAPPLVSISYWQEHGIFLLLFLTMFPRLALLLSSVSSGGLFWWLGWFFAPRLLVAVLATGAYLETNPLLVAIAWIIAFSGEFSEKEFVRRRSHSYFDQRPTSDKTTLDETIIEAEYKDLS